MRISRTGFSLVLLSSLLAAPATAEAQAPPVAAGEPFGASVDVELVEVEVFVSDAHGAPVRGLSPADFGLTIDGERREIAAVYEARPRAELSAPTLTAVPGESPPPAPAGITPPPPPAQQQSLVVLLDELHLQPAGRKRTLDRLAALLAERLAAGDKVMIATLDRSLVVRRGFEASGPLAADLAAIAKRAPGGVHSEIERRQTLSQIRDVFSDRGCQRLDEMTAIANAWTADVERESRATLSGVQAMLESLAGRSGRKTLLYVTEGMSLTPGLEAKLLIQELCPSDGGGASTGLVGLVGRVTRAANAAQVTLYSLDAGGQRVLASAVDAGPDLSFANQSAVRSDTQDPAFALATDTGGKALLESNRPELLLADLAQDLAAYYSLAFTPRPGDAGRSHRIAVEVRRPGIRVRHRSAWDPVSREDRLAGRLLAALHFGGEDANPLQVRLETGTPQRESDATFTVPLRLVVPASALTLLPRGDRRQGSLRVLLAVEDDEGRSTPVRSMPLPVDLPTAPAAQPDLATVPLQLRLKLRAGRNLVALAVRDEVGQETSVVRREIALGAGH